VKGINRRPTSTFHQKFQSSEHLAVFGPQNERRTAMPQNRFTVSWFRVISIRASNWRK